MILMSNNQWKCDKNNAYWAEKGEDCSAEARVPGLVRAYLQVMPDVLGLQEVSLRQAELMMNEMKRVELPDGSVAQYEYLSGGDTPIVFRRDKLKLLESGFFRYDEAVPGLTGSFNNSETKSYTWGVFEDRNDKKRFVLTSTHLWWRSGNPASASYQEGSDIAREYQIGLCAEKTEEVMNRYSCPGVIMGDFNASINSLCLKKAFSLGWQEVHDLAVGDRSETRGHHSCGTKGYGRTPDGGKYENAIDHIIIKNAPGAVVKYFRRVEDEWFDKISDHYPLYIDVEF